MERLRLTGKCDGSNLLILKPSPDVGMAPRKPNLTELSVFVPRGAVPQCRPKAVRHSSKARAWKAKSTFGCTSKVANLSYFTVSPLSGE